MNGKTVLISGGSSGIGRGTALVMAEQGWDIAVTYNRNREGAEETQRAVQALGCACHIIEAHLEAPDAPERMVSEARELLGRLDAYVCNAGRDARNSILTTDRAGMQRILDTNFLGYLLSAGAAARAMVADGVRGSIVFVTSTRAVSPHPDDFLYGGVKAAIERAARSMALELSAYGIRVNCCAPGATRVRPSQSLEVKPGTLINGRPYYPIEDVIPLGRMGAPEDPGRAVAYLCGEDSGYVTGTTLTVDGGLSLPGMPEWSAPCEWMSPEWVAANRKRMTEIYPEAAR